MLTSFRIQNFRSIHDASVKLGQVNLFIGPNNSGKSNFLKGVNLAASILSNTNKDGHAGRRNLPKKLQELPYDSPATMSFTTTATLKSSEIATVVTSLTDDILQLKTTIRKVVYHNPLFPDEIIHGETQNIPNELRYAVKNTLIYNTNPERLQTSG